MENQIKPGLTFKKKSILRLSSDEMRAVIGAAAGTREFDTTMMTTSVNVAVQLNEE